MTKPANLSSILNDQKGTGMDMRPQYYSHGGIECREVIKAWNLNFNLGNALKYICRCNQKDNKAQDLRKAIKYLEFELDETPERCWK